MAEAKNPLGFISPDDSMEGFEDINARTIAIPFIRILQPLSPQLNKKDPEYIEGAEVGQFFNTVTKKVYGNELSVIVLKFEHLYIEWLPNRGGFVDVHSPENAMRLVENPENFGKWKTVNGNDLSETYTYFVLVDGEEKEGPACLSLASSAIKTGKQLNKIITSHIMPSGERAKPYYLIVDLHTEYKTNDKGSWYVPIAEFGAYINEEQYNIIKPERKALPDKSVDYAQLSETTGGDSDDNESAGNSGKSKVPY